MNSLSKLPTFEELYQLADASSERTGVAAAGGADRTVLQALSEAANRGWVTPIVCGDQAEIETIAQELNIDLSVFSVIDSNSPAVDAVKQIHAGNAQLLMKGQVSTPDLMKAILDKEAGLRTGRIICQMVLMEIPKDNKCFLMSDTGITISPSLEQKRDLLNHMIQTAQSLGCETPKIALMSATEKVNSTLPDTLDSSTLVEESASNNFGTCHVEGPLSFDLAYDTEAGDKKKLESKVIGRADGMLFPDLTSANLTVKALMYAAESNFGGNLCGTSAPVVFMSRADDVKTRLNSLAYTLQILSTK